MTKSGEPKSVAKVIPKSFKLIEPGSAVDFADLCSPDNELWLIQLPRNVTTASLDGCQLSLRVGQAADDVQGSMQLQSGSLLDVVEEAPGIASHCHVVAPTGDATLGVVGKQLRRVTISVSQRKAKKRKSQGDVLAIEAAPEGDE